jgi:hypothetical protein
MNKITDYTYQPCDDKVARRAIRSGITPKKCEQMSLHKLNKIFMNAGFDRHDIQGLFSRWGIFSARAIQAHKRAEERRNLTESFIPEI